MHVHSASFKIRLGFWHNIAKMEKEIEEVTKMVAYVKTRREIEFQERVKTTMMLYPLATTNYL